MSLCVPTIKKVTIQVTFSIYDNRFNLHSSELSYIVFHVTNKINNQLIRASVEFLENYQWALF